MKGTILVCGYGPGISESVARRFGSEGYSVALVARNQERVDKGAGALRDAGIKAQGFSCDLGDPAATRAMVGDVQKALGPIAVVHYNAYAGLAGDLLTSSADDLRKVLDVGVTGLVVTVQSALADLKSQERPAVLITGGGFAFYDDNVDKMTVAWNAMGLGVAKAAQHKLARLLRHKLSSEGVYVGEVVVLGMVKGTAFDSGNATIDPASVAEKFWALFEGRTEHSVTIQ